MKIAVLIPCCNEEKTIEKVISDFKKELPNSEIYVYDNNSTDKTFEVASALCAIVRKETNQGKANVVRTMFSEIDADVYVLVDGDDTYPSGEIKKLIATLIDGNYDMVVGDRLSNNSYGKENKRRFHLLGNNLTKVLINKIFKANLKDIMSGYRVFSRKFVKNYPVMCSNFELETEMTIFSLFYRMKLKEIPINYQDRPEGSFSKLNTFSDGKEVLLTIFNLFRYYKPFLFFTITAIFFFILSFVVGFPVVLEFINFKYIYKVPSAVLASSLMVLSIYSFSIGLILDSIASNEKRNFELRLKKYDSR